MDLWVSEDQPLLASGAALPQLYCEHSPRTFTARWCKLLLGSKKVCVLMPRHQNNPVNPVTLHDMHLFINTQNREMSILLLVSWCNYMKIMSRAQKIHFKTINYANYLIGCFSLVVSSFCSKLSFLSFHKFPAIMPKKSKSPRFLLEANFCQQSSGLLMSNV